MFTENAPFGGRRRPRSGLEFPARFLNLLVLDKPDDFRSILTWAKKFFRSSGLFRDIVDKLSRYPVTSVEVTGPHADRWSKLLNHELRIREKLVAIGINRHVYGNCFVSIIPRFTRYLLCPHCKNHLANQIGKVNWKYMQGKFSGTCNSCKKHGIFSLRDEYKKGSPEEIAKHVHIKVWPTESIYVKINNVTNDYKIIYKLDKNEVNAIQKSDRFIIETMPSDFLEAVQKYGEKASIELDQSRTFWYKEEDLEEPNSIGMALPFFFAAWKTLWQVFIHRKIQESILSDRMISYRILHPQAVNNLDPIASLDLGQWRSSMSQMLHRFYNDPNEIGLAPGPVGMVQIGGDGKAMSITQEIEQLNHDLLTELGIPPELIYGGMSWTGSNIALRMLENRFLYTINMHNTFLTSLCGFISSHFDIIAPESVQLAPFRMADDIAKANMYLGLAAQGKISTQRALGILGDGINFAKEAEDIANEKNSLSTALSAIQVANAEAAGDASRVQNREQVITQIEAQSLQNSLTPTLNGSIADAVSIMTPQGIVNKLNSLPEMQRQMELQNIAATNPQMYEQIVQAMGMGNPEQAGPMNRQSEPLPDQKPPRREGVNQRI